MRVEGIYEITADPCRVWDTLMDPNFLRRSIPGCQEMVESDEGVYQVKMKAGLGAVRGKFAGEVRLEDVRAPEHYRMVTNARGNTGFINGTGDVDLEARDGITEIHYQGEIQVGGMLAAVGSRMIEAAFRKSVNEFFAAVTSHINGDDDFGDMDEEDASEEDSAASAESSA